MRKTSSASKTATAVPNHFCLLAVQVSGFHRILFCYTGEMEGLKNYSKEERPWGNFERFTLNEKSTVKIIIVKAGEEFSLQSHKHRDEFWRVLSGSGIITLDEEHHTINTGENFFSPVGHEHRMEGGPEAVSYTHLRAHETVLDLVCRLLLEKKKK